MTAEYTYLFNTVSHMMEDVRNLQFWLMLKEAGAVQYCVHESAEDVKKAADLLLDAVGGLIVRFQETQASLMLVQQNAEEIYLERCD